MVNSKRVCRLCFKKCNSDFEAIQGITQEILDVLLLKLNLAISEEPVMCANCAKILQKCFDFKSTCFYTQDYIVPFVSDKVNSKLDLKEIYRNKVENENVINNLEDHSVCGFCLDVLERGSFASLGNEEKTLMLEKCLPELDLSVVKEPIICATCEKCLQEYFKFTENCLNIEEKIEKYCKAKGITNKCLINLKNVMQFDDNSDVKIDINADQSKIDSFHSTPISAQADVMASDQKNSSGEQIMYNCASCPYQTKHRKHMVVHSVRHKDPSRVKMYKCKYCTYETKYSSMSKHIRYFHTEEKESKRYHCCICSFKTKFHGSFRNHMTRHMNRSVVPIYKCKSCAYYTKDKESLEVHAISHMYRCTVCSYECTDKKTFGKHVHNSNSSEATIYTCDKCTFGTKFKQNLITHMLRHKKSSEVKMYSCSICLYETKYASALNKHIIVHKKDSETSIYKCSSCSFTTKHQKSLKTHELSHKDPSELTMYKCSVCVYESREKSLLKKHMDYVHKDPSEMTMYKCASCPFQSKYKSHLRIHVNKH